MKFHHRDLDGQINAIIPVEGWGQVLQMRHMHSGLGSDPATKPRIQYLYNRGGIYARTLPPTSPRWRNACADHHWQRIPPAALRLDPLVKAWAAHHGYDLIHEAILEMTMHPFCAAILPDNREMRVTKEGLYEIQPPNDNYWKTFEHPETALEWYDKKGGAA